MKSAIFALFISLGCSSAPPISLASVPIQPPPQAMSVCPDLDDFKLCIQIARAQSQSADELADCIEMRGYRLDRDMRKIVLVR